MSFPRKKDSDSSDTQSASSLASALTGTQSSFRSGSMGNVDTVLGKGTKVSGTLSFSGPVEIDGEVEGEIHAKEKIVIGENAIVKAKITGSELFIRGTIHGDVSAAKALTLRKPAKIYGNITAPLLSIEDGVLFEGKCSMQAKSVEASTHASPVKTGEIKISEVKTPEAAKSAVSGK